jgi:hypothetical protein
MRQVELKKMKKWHCLTGAALTALLTIAVGTPPAVANDTDLVFHAKGGKPSGGGSGGSDGGGTVSAPTYYGWMSPGIIAAWDANNGSGGFLGQGVDITVVDDFSSRSRLWGNLGDGLQRQRHGEWTLKQAGMIAPRANMIADDFYNAGAIALNAERFNVLSLSYGYTAPLDRDLEKTIVEAAAGNLAFIAKSAGNEYGRPVGHRQDGGFDYLSLGLIGALGGTGDTINATAYDSTIFVGALDWNVVGTNDPRSAIASYSSIAGDNTNVQRQFLVVGVESATGGASFGTGLAGTSFAAPIVAGYGAVLSSKFQVENPQTVAARLLETAKVDTILGYNPAIHGQGEADIARAISPDAIK